MLKSLQGKCFVQLQIQTSEWWFSESLETDQYDLLIAFWLCYNVTYNVYNNFIACILVCSQH